MQATHHRVGVLNKFRRYPRVRIPTPFSCSVAPLLSNINGWFHNSHKGVGVVYDLSLRGVRVSTEAVLKPGDMVALTLQLPKQISPTTIKVATVRWGKDQIYGLAFRTLSQSTLSRLSKYMTITTMEKE